MGVAVGVRVQVASLVQQEAHSKKTKNHAEHRILLTSIMWHAERTRGQQPRLLEHTEFHLHQVDGDAHGCSDEHHVSIDVELLVYRPLHRLIDQYGRQNVDKCNVQDCRYDLCSNSSTQQLQNNTFLTELYYWSKMFLCEHGNKKLQHKETFRLFESVVKVIHEYRKVTSSVMSEEMLSCVTGI